MENKLTGYFNLIGVYTLLPSRHFIDAKTRAWLTWVEQHISPKIQSDTDYFL